jgi:hypothetical protein
MATASHHEAEQELPEIKPASNASKKRHWGNSVNLSGRLILLVRRLIDLRIDDQLHILSISISYKLQYCCYIAGCRSNLVFVGRFAINFPIA